VRVTDNGSPPLSDAKTFTITVNPLKPTPPRVMYISAVLIKKKGTGAIDVFFNEPMDLNTAGASRDYLVVIPRKGHGKKGHSPRWTPVAFSTRYNPADDSVSLVLRKPTKRPLQVTVRKVVTAANGLLLGTDYTVDV
jgi:hypothetical protein